MYLDKLTEMSEYISLDTIITDYSQKRQSDDVFVNSHGILYNQEEINPK